MNMLSRSWNADYGLGDAGDCDDFGVDTGAISWEGERLVPGLVLWLAVVAIAQALLAYSWKSRALAWEAAYSRDIQRSETRFQHQTQSPRQIQSQSPRTDFADQFRAVLIPFAQKLPARLQRTSAPDDDWRDTPQNIRNTNRVSCVASSEPLLEPLLPNSQGTSYRTPQTRSDLIRTALEKPYRIGGNTAPFHMTYIV